MDFLTMRDFRSKPKTAWEKLSQNGEIVITNNGKPTVLMLNIENGNFDVLLRAIKQAKAMMALNAIRTEAENRGFLREVEI